MAVIYLLTKVQEPQTPDQRLKLHAALQEHFPEKWHGVGQDCYLVATNRPILTEELSRELKIADGEVGSYIVTNLDPYYGYANRSIWEWVRNMRQWNEQS